MDDLFGSATPEDDLFGDNSDSAASASRPIDTFRSLIEQGDGKGAIRHLRTLNKHDLSETLLKSGFALSGGYPKWVDYASSPLLMAAAERQLPRNPDGPEAPSTITTPDDATPNDGMPPGSEAFTDWFGESVATDEQGKPLLLFRGEHGEPDAPDTLQHRTSSISFSTLEAANHYAENPNVRTDDASHQRMIPAYLSIQKPVMNNPGDPFLEFEDIIAALGPDKAAQIARDMAMWIEGTDNWGEHYEDDYDTVANFVSQAPERLAELYVQAWPVFDKPRYVSWFAEAGYDGVVHGGCAATFGEPEYKAFTPDCVRSALAHQTFAPTLNHAGASPATQCRDKPFADHRLFAPLPSQEALSLSHVDASTGLVANATSSGDLLQQVAYESRYLLEETGLACDWMDGGSRMFADALQEWSGGKITLGVTSRDGESASHAVGVLALGDTPNAPRVYLDADGVSSSGDLLAKLDWLETTPHQRVMATGRDAGAAARGLHSDDSVTRRMLTGLRMALPSFDAWETKFHRDMERKGLDYPIEKSPEPRQQEHASPVRGGAMPEM